MNAIEPGDYCVVPTPGIYGTLISIGQALNGETLSRHDHAMVYIGRADASAPHGYTASAYPDRKGIRALQQAPEAIPGAVWSSQKIPLTQEQRSGIVAWCLAHPAVPYSWTDYGALALHRLRVPVPGLQEFIARDQSMICSQYTDSAYLYGGGVHLFKDGRWPGYVTPASLAGLLEAA